MKDKLSQFYKEEFINYLEGEGVDTVCFMGQGYSFEDVKVGAEFYRTYAYYGSQSVIRYDSNTCEKVLVDVLAHYGDEIKESHLTDRFKLIQKYKYYDVMKNNIELRTLTKGRERREYVRVQNLRTKKIYILNEFEIDNFYLLLFITW